MTLTIKEAQEISYSNLRQMIVGALSLGAEVKLVSGEHHIYSLEYEDKKVLIKNISSVYNTRVSTILAADKILTKKVLADAGLKVPKGFVVREKEDFKKLYSAGEIKFPIVIKPSGLMEGQGVVANIDNVVDSLEAIEDIVKIKDAVGKDIMIEEYFAGQDFRVLVVEDEVIAALERIHPHIIGNGRDSIEELIKQRRNGEEKGGEAKRSLLLAGYKRSDILENGKLLRIRQNANVSTGAMTRNVTNEISPFFKKIAIAAVKALGLGAGGVDILTKDISISKGDYRMIEINGCPDLDIHRNPTYGDDLDVHTLVVKKMLGIK